MFQTTAEIPIFSYLWLQKFVDITLGMCFYLYLFPMQINCLYIATNILWFSRYFCFEFVCILYCFIYQYNIFAIFFPYKMLSRYLWYLFTSQNLYLVLVKIIHFIKLFCKINKLSLNQGRRFRVEEFPHLRIKVNTSLNFCKKKHVVFIFISV